LLAPVGDEPALPADDVGAEADATEVAAPAMDGTAANLLAGVPVLDSAVADGAVARTPGGGVAAAARLRTLPRALAIANQKGGVGKTTTAVNLGAGMAELGYRVLIVDLDPQGNATTGLGVNARNLQSSIYDAIMNETPIEDCIEPTTVRNLFVAPATIDLAGAEIELVPAFSR